MPSPTDFVSLTLDPPPCERSTPNSLQDEETMVADGRAGLTPSQCVDQKLATILRQPAYLEQPRQRMIPGVH